MRNFLVVQKKVDDVFLKNCKNYRGVDRPGIPFPEEFFNSGNFIEKVFYEYEKITEDDMFIRDLSFSLRLRDLFNLHYPNLEFETIEIVYDMENLKSTGIFLGFDIFSFSNSNILRIILDFQDLEYDLKLTSFQNCIKSTSNLFLRQLNEFRLFDNYNSAKKCLDELNKCFINLSKPSTHHFHRVGAIYLIE